MKHEIRPRNRTSSVELLVEAAAHLTPRRLVVACPLPTQSPPKSHLTPTENSAHGELNRRRSVPGPSRDKLKEVYRGDFHE